MAIDKNKVSLEGLKAVYDHVEEDIGGLRSALNNASQVVYKTDISSTVGLIPFHAKNGDRITIKTKDGSNFIDADQLRFYDADGAMIEYWITAPSTVNSRTFTYNKETEALYISITKVAPSVVDYIVINNNSDYNFEPTLVNIQNGIDQLHSEMDQNISRLDANLGDYLGRLFELGNITISASGWVYSAAGSRLRTKKGTYFHLKAGTVVGLRNYVGYTYYVGWRKDDGTYDYHDGWLQQDFTITEEADYVFLLRYNTESTITDPDALANNFFGYSLSDDIWQNIYGTFNEFETVPFTLYNGFISSTGSITPQTGDKERYTSLITCVNGDVFHISIIYTASHALWLSYGLYDEFGDFITRVNVESYLVGYGETFAITINNEKARYIAFTYRGFDDSTAVITSKKILSIPTNAVSLLRDQLGWYVSSLNANVKSVNHRGYNSIAPENTLPAYQLSKRKGFEYVETDVSFTSDGVAVLLHDDTINRTARNADGTAISTTINISDITYDEALEYDFGIWKGEEYAGTRIPTFAQFISLCKKIGLKPYIELKANGTTQERIASLVATVASYQMLDYVTWISFVPQYLQYVLTYDPSARLGVVCSGLTSTTVSDALALKTTDNYVFIDAQNGTTEEVALAKNAGLPLEVWGVNTAAGLNTLDGYITGATTDVLLFGYELYKANVG